jgi:hypothetical protein
MSRRCTSTIRPPRGPSVSRAVADVHAWLPGRLPAGRRRRRSGVSVTPGAGPTAGPGVACLSAPAPLGCRGRVGLLTGTGRTVRLTSTVASAQMTNTSSAITVGAQIGSYGRKMKLLIPDSAAKETPTTRAQVTPAHRKKPAKNCDSAEHEVAPAPCGGVDVVGVVAADDELVVGDGGDADQHLPDAQHDQRNRGEESPAGRPGLFGVASACHDRSSSREAGSAPCALVPFPR